MPPSRHAFRAQLVMEDAAGSRTGLKHSKRHGELVLDAAEQSAQLVYPRVGGFFRRKYQQPLKCVLGRKLLRVYSSNGKRNFTCRLLSENDAAKCSETLSSFGGRVEVIGVGESMLSSAESRRGSAIQNAAVLAGGEAALEAIREASPSSMRAGIRDYEESDQLRDDMEAIVHAMFSADT